jgi:hypothetical protein
MLYIVNILKQFQLDSCKRYVSDTNCSSYIYVRISSTSQAVDIVQHSIGKAGNKATQFQISAIHHN